MQGSTLYVGNLSSFATKEKLHELFSGYGNIVHIKIIGDNAFGFIEMSNQSEAENARNSLNGYNFEGNNLKVGEARPKNYNTRARNPRR